MEINTLMVNELDDTSIGYLKMLGYKEDDMVDIASWITDDEQVMSVIVPPKK